MPKRSRMPRDPNLLAARIVAIATEGQEADTTAVKKPAAKKNPASIALGRKGGKKGGKARAEWLSKERRVEIARAAAAKRWDKTED